MRMRPNLTLALFMYRFRSGWIWHEIGGWSKTYPPSWSKNVAEEDQPEIERSVEAERAWLAKLSDPERESYWRTKAAFILTERQIVGDRRKPSLDAMETQPSKFGYECGDPLQMTLVDMADDLLTEIMGRADSRSVIERDNKYAEFLDRRFFSALLTARPDLLDFIAAQPDADGYCTIGGKRFEALTSEERAVLTPEFIRKISQPLDVIPSSRTEQVEAPKLRTTLIRNLLLQGLTPTQIRNRLDEQRVKVDLNLVKQVRRDLPAHFIKLIQRAGKMTDQSDLLLKLVEGKQFKEAALLLKGDFERWLENNSNGCKPEDMPGALAGMIDVYERSSVIDSFTALVMRELVESKQFARAIVLLEKNV